MKPSTVEVGPEQPNGGRVRRSALSPDKLLETPAYNVRTLYDVLANSAENYPDRRGFGFRKLEKMIEEEKEVKKIIDGEEVIETKKWSYFQLSQYNYFTYKEASRLCHDIGAGLIKLGLKEHDKVEIFSPTNMYWLLTAHATFTQNMTIVTAYDTLGEAGLLHSMNETEVTAIYTVGSLLPVVAKVAKKCPTLKYIIYMGEGTQDNLDAVADATQTVVALEEVARMGRNNPIEPVKPKPEDLCCIMYTSGSTGNPKGVLLTHKNIVSGIAANNKSLGYLNRGYESMIAYLPLAHVLEFLVENLCIYWGVTLGYATVRTLTDLNVRNCQGDIKEFRPTLMTGVPQVWESIRKGILAKIDLMPPTTKNIFQKAFAAKSWLYERHLPAGVLDKIVFNKVRENVGGRLRFALSGGAPVSIETQKFLSLVLCPVLGGFGMTETCGIISVVAPHQFAYGEVGSIAPCCEVKLVDVPNTDYKSTNKPKPQGEIWVRGNNITSGYWRREDVTKETLTEDRWLMTGDIGEWNPSGSLTIIDRKKNLVKLSNGEYIALEKLESIYKSCILILNICVYADSFHPKPVALAVVSEPIIQKLAIENNIAETDFEKLCRDSTIRKKVLAALIQQGKDAGLSGNELILDVHLAHEEWTPQNNMVTSAQKLKRPELTKAFKAELDEMNAKQKN
ncbi:hypothetical protein BDB01DRAFT_807139 [Pilobolus umbonatus]|nr:hypothetical protein BDB01DRAFT_807139 [Pilobolus umbonatus]